jgi:hypothetical protein
MSGEEVFRRASPSIFVLKVYNSKGVLQRFGSAVAVAPDLLVSNKHVAGAVAPPLTYYEVTQGDVSWPAIPMWYARDDDLALILVPGLKAAASPRKIPLPKVGARVYAIGSPSGLESTLTDGLVSGVRRFEGQSSGPLLQFSAPISPGSSGGGLFDARGNLVGITTAFMKDAQGLSFAIPSTLVTDLLAKGNAAAARYFVEGVVRSMAGDKGASKALQECVTLEPHFAQGWLLLSRFGSAQEKVEWCRRATEADPLLKEAWIYYADSLDSFASFAYLKATVGKDSPAERVLPAGLKSELFTLRSRALAAMETACRIDPTDVESKLKLARIYDDLEQHDAEARVLREVLLAHPQNVRAQVELCSCLVYISDPKVALSNCQAALLAARSANYGSSLHGWAAACVMELSRKLGDQVGANAAREEWVSTFEPEEKSLAASLDRIEREGKATAEKYKPVLDAVLVRLGKEASR